MNTIKLTDVNTNELIYINVDKIVYVKNFNIETTNGPVFVKETADQILELISKKDKENLDKFLKSIETKQ